MTVKYFMLEMPRGPGKATVIREALGLTGKVNGLCPSGDLFPGIRAEVADAL